MGMSKESRLTLAISLSFCFMIVEVAGGLYANSLSILADAAHLFSDVTGFVIALIAVILSKHPPSSSFTYGMARAEVMGAFCSVVTLWAVTIYLVYTAYIRVVLWLRGEAEPVDGKLMFIIACFGILVNVCLALVFHEDTSSLSAHAHDHSHSHGHAHDHSHGGGHNENEGLKSEGHDHSHDHHHAGEKTSLIQHQEGKSTYGGVEIDYGHSHGHHHASADHSHDHNHGGSCSSHGHGSLEASNHIDPLSPVAHTTTTGDVNLQAAHMHVIADLIQSAGVALAGAAIWYNPEWQIIDPISTFLFSFLVVWATFALMYRILSIFMEGTPAHLDYYAVLKDLQELEGVTDVHDLHIWSISSEAVSLTCHMRAHNPEDALKQAHKVCSKFNIQHPTIQVQSVTDSEECHAPACSSSSGNVHCSHV